MRYPAWEKKLGLLRCVHAWIQKRDAADDFGAVVDMAEVDRWASSIQGMSKTEAVYGVKQLVDEGYVTLVHMSKEITPAPWLLIVPQSLTDKGLIALGEMPDPQERFIVGLEAAIRAIREDGQMEEPEKKRRIDVLEEAKQIGRPLAVDIIKGILKGDFPIL